ncbi:hypothetical protein CERSUDRAFT_112233 [Gelatoporia subvermispora B]|uniref:mRNA stability protein n=1 Tax=Ceriporiopsis subvermispora (strain B) TaxID=914234 RepID=M2QSI5_CERS8|nr:hypothetical protein CERSUDRAFT_112233 [Gelatoporia subvermispora B]
MLPAQRNKVDISKLTEEEQKLFRLYGKLPNHKNVLMKMQKDRKYFDSGDYALSKAGVAPQHAVGTAIPNPEKYVKCALSVSRMLIFLAFDSSIPHASSPPNHGHGQSLSISPTNSSATPAKESPLAETENSATAETAENENENENENTTEE